MLYDLRTKQNKFNDEHAFGRDKGIVTALQIDSDGLSMGVGTSAGFVSSYDFRYGVKSAIHENKLGEPILAMENFKKTVLQGLCNMSLVSLGGSEQKVCQLNIDTS